MSPEDVVELADAQLGLCAVCLAADALHVDHDHAKGRVRGMLCFACNVAVGQLGDRADVARRAADYLEDRHVRLCRVACGVVQLVHPRVTEVGAVDTPRERRQLVDIAALRRAGRGA